MININDLVDKIYRLNDVKDGFWKDYLEEIRSDFKVTWHRSCGYDLRPLYIIKNFGYSKTRVIRKIPKEIKKTDIIFSDAAEYDYTHEFYNELLDLWKNNQKGVFYGVYLNNRKENWQFKFPSNISDVTPFKLFTEEERKELKKMHFKNSWGEGNEVTPIINLEREFDGFAMKINGYDFSESYITLIYLFLDDRITKKIFFDYNIEIVCLFESRTSGKGGGLPFSWLFYDLEEFKDIKYIFTDKCVYDDEKSLLKLDYELIADKYVLPFDNKNQRGTFCLAIKNQHAF